MAEIPDIRSGDLVKVYAKIKEGDKERIAPFQGVVIKIRGRETAKTITLRKISAGIGIERIFPLYSPLITKIEIKKSGKVRRAKLTYLRQRRGRRMKIKDQTAVTQASEKSSAVEEPKEKTAPGSTKQPSEQPKEDTGEGAAGQKPVDTV